MCRSRKYTLNEVTRRQIFQYRESLHICNTLETVFYFRQGFSEPRYLPRLRLMHSNKFL